jgi:hypothetical protein
VDVLAISLAHSFLFASRIDCWRRHTIARDIAPATGARQMALATLPTLYTMVYNEAVLGKVIQNSIFGNRRRGAGNVGQRGK